MLHCDEVWRRMAGGIVSVAQQKRGSGRPRWRCSWAWHGSAPAGACAMLTSIPGQPVRLVQRPAPALGEAENGLLVQGLSGWRLGGELRRLRREFDLVVVDSPAHAESDARAAIREADLALVPCQPNALDVGPRRRRWSWRRGRTAALLVLNRVPPRGRAAEQMRAEIAAQRWPVAGALLGNRQAYAASIGEGRGVAETAPEAPPAGRSRRWLTRCWRGSRDGTAPGRDQHAQEGIDELRSDSDSANRPRPSSAASSVTEERAPEHWLFFAIGVIVGLLIG